MALGELLPGGSSHDLGEEVDVEDEPAVEPLLLGCIESSKATFFVLLLCAALSRLSIVSSAFGLALLFLRPFVGLKLSEMRRLGGRVFWRRVAALLLPPADGVLGAATT